MCIIIYAYIMASRCAKKVYEFGEKRCLKLTKDIVCINDGVKDKRIEVPIQRWMNFICFIDEIDRVLLKLTSGEYVNYKQHFGAAWYISVTTGFPCIDLRKFYLTAVGFEEKPTKEGFAIRVREWTAFKGAVHRMHAENPKLKQVQPCGDHQNQEEGLQCKECYPFADVVYGFKLQ